ncbi:hypothetical protein [Bradyrhizobium sp. STM 3809]|uniref:hypothetical protein n=1 Tax=Bradyrhizobium sp. STM 3809 TaxID=551936 RepID=UPI0002408283|nr:hypothetical protein [Bradyrhizobium sp. STM 3809]CCE03538.1 Prevent-host-death protein [Bradyrhizobium sp. STM 3809]
MAVATIDSRDFDLNRARLASLSGPVFITEDGSPTHVLLGMKDYLRLTGDQIGLAEALAQPDADFAFDPPRMVLAARAPTELE